MNSLQTQLEQIKIAGNYRSLCDIDSVTLAGSKCDSGFVNLSSNDYLGLASDLDLKREFLSGLSVENFRPSASSSRLLTGNTTEYIQLECSMAQAYQAESALLFTSGYHANSGIIPAITNEQSLILADKLVHASMIDGIKLSSAKCIRFKHNNYDQLERLVASNTSLYDSILIVTESIFSMDGDEADLIRLVQIKQKYSNVQLFIDEAHAFGIRGKKGLGCCEEAGCIADIDYIVGTFGKALASVGAFVISTNTAREYLINTVRPLIFTTALPPVNLAWSHFVFSRLAYFNEKREHLAYLASLLHDFIASSGQPVISSSHIVPYLVGESSKAVAMAQQLQQQGFFVMPIRQPTVPAGSARLRISLSAEHTVSQINALIQALKTFDFR